MTSFDLSSPVRTTPSTTATPDILAAVTGAVPLQVTVTAVVVTRGHTPYLNETLAAVRAQTAAPDSVLVVDAAATEASVGYQDLQLGEARYVAAPRVRSFGQAVDAALLLDHAGTWLWLLHDDSAPAPDALAELLRAVEHSSHIAVAGPKQRGWEASDSAGRLVEVGFTTSPLGQRMTGIDDHEIDQGQHDAREDVYAVGLAGSLVRREVWMELSGTDPEYGVFGDGLDFSRRARRAGHRVIVVPRAVVRHAQASLLGLRGREAGRVAGDPDASYGQRRRSHFHDRLVSVPAAMLPLVAVAMVLAAPFHAMYRLIVKQPRHARDELVAPLWALLRVRGIVRARRTAQRTATIPRRALRPLRGTWREVYTQHRDRRLARVEQRRAGVAPTELERADLRALAVRRRAMLAGVVAVLTGMTVTVFGPLIGVLALGGRLVGGALLPASTTLADVWRATTSGWVATGLGTPAPADPFLSVLTVGTALVGGSAQTAVHALVVGSFVLAGLGAWFASGALTRSVLLRAWSVLVWIAAPALTHSLDTGRVGSLLTHAALPWVALAIIRALGAQRVDGPTAQRGPESGSLGAAAAAGLALAVAVAGAPVLLPVAVVVLAVVAACVRRNRRYLALVPVVAVVVFAPFYLHVVRTWNDDGWRLLFAEPGAPLASAPPSSWQLLLGASERGPSLLDLSQPVATVGAWATLAVGAALAVLAVVAVIRAQRGAALAWCVAAIGLATAVVAGQVAVARDGAEPVTGWPAAGLSVACLALLGTALVAFPVRPERGAARAGRVGVVVLACAVTVLPLVAVGAWTADVLGSDDPRVGLVRASAEPVVPPVGQQVQAPPRSARVLVLDVAPAGGVDYQALRADGSQIVDSSVAVDLAALADPTVAQGELPGLVAELASGLGSDIASRLGDLGVGAVMVPADAVTRERAELVARLDMVPGLDRITEGQSGAIWRVASPEPSAGEDVMGSGWARIDTPGEPSVTVPSTDRRVGTTVPAGARERFLVLAENADPGWRATLGGVPLDRVEAAGLQTFRLGATGGRLHVEHVTEHRTAWMVVSGVTLVIYMLLAVPVRRRRAGR